MIFINTLQGRARQLYNAGYKSLTHLANANPEVLIRTIDHLSRRQAKQIVSSAKVSKQGIFLIFMIFYRVISLYFRHVNYRHKDIYHNTWIKIVHMV